MMQTQNENAPLARGNFGSVATHLKLDSVPNPQTDKAFSTWQAKFAMHGHTLYRTASADGSILYLAARWGMTRELPTLDAVATFYAQIGGKV